MTRRITLSDVAREAGVSLMTVSRVVNGKGEISPEARERVKDVIETLGHRPGGIARSLATRQTNTIGLVVPGIVAYSEDRYSSRTGWNTSSILQDVIAFPEWGTLDGMTTTMPA